MTNAQKTTHLGFVPAAYTLIAAGAIMLVPPTVLMLYALNRELGLDIGYLKVRPPVVFLMPHALFLYVFGPVLGCFLFWFRQAGGAKVTWDEHGVTEWDAKGVRVAIPWATLRRSIVQVIVRTKGGGRHSGGQIHQLSDGQGRRITLATSDGRVNWMFHRRMFTKASSLQFTGHEPHGGFPAGDGVQSDDPRRPGAWFMWLTRLGYLAAFGAVGLVGLQNPSNRDIGSAVLLLLAGSFILFLRLLRPFAELRRLWARDRELSGGFCYGATLLDNQGTLVTASGTNGGTFQFDTAHLNHPDGLLHLRRTGVRYVLDANKAVANPEGAPIPLLRLEHDGIRDARRTLKLAIVAEIIVRACIALTLALTALVLIIHVS